MKERQVGGGSLLLVGALLTGCDMGASNTTTPSDSVKTVCGSNYNCMLDLMVHYRALADDLVKMAQEYAREADYQAIEFGQDSPKVRTSRSLAQKAWLEAEEAAFLARQYEYELSSEEEMSHRYDKTALPAPPAQRG